MGYLHYDSRRFEFDDRTLTHLRSVVFAKFSLQESLAFTWTDDGLQRSIWLHPSIPLHFEFADESTPEIEPAWMEHLLLQANSPGGIRNAEPATE